MFKFVLVKIMGEFFCDLPILILLFFLHFPILFPTPLCTSSSFLLLLTASSNLSPLLPLAPFPDLFPPFPDLFPPLPDHSLLSPIIPSFPRSFPFFTRSFLDLFLSLPDLSPIFSLLSPIFSLLPPSLSRLRSHSRCGHQTRLRIRGV